MISPYVVCKFMTKYSADIRVQPETIISVGAKPEQDDFSGVLVEAEQVRVFMWCEFCQRPDGEFVFLHNMLDSWIIGEAV